MRTLKTILGALVLLLLTGCEQKTPPALDMPRPTVTRTQPPEEVSAVRPTPRLSLRAKRLGDVIVHAHQIGYLEPGRTNRFELELFDTSEWPGLPRAWVGSKETDARWHRESHDAEGRTLIFMLPVPNPIPANSMLWISLPSPEQAGERTAAGFNLARE